MTKRCSVVLMTVMVLATAAFAQPSAEQTLRALLTEFLDAAGRGDKAVFERFFADDVIYTRATGVVVTKADIMKSLDEPRPADAPVYHAADVVVRVHGNTAVVNFMLVAVEQPKSLLSSTIPTTRYRNTGTFMLRNGRWQVVAWQATKLVEPEKK
jgi:hypothetical protein